MSQGAISGIQFSASQFVAEGRILCLEEPCPRDITVSVVRAKSSDKPDTVTISNDGWHVSACCCSVYRLFVVFGCWRAVSTR
jgi:hypothetical protein